MWTRKLCAQFMERDLHNFSAFLFPAQLFIIFLLFFPLSLSLSPAVLLHSLTYAVYSIFYHFTLLYDSCGDWMMSVYAFCSLFLIYSSLFRVKQKSQNKLWCIEHGMHTLTQHTAMHSNNIKWKISDNKTTMCNTLSAYGAKASDWGKKALEKIMVYSCDRHS